MASQLLPLELIDKCVGSRIWVIMKGDKVAHYSASTTSDYTGTSTKMSKILLNGNNICMLIPGGMPE
ncbi:unnamed protein product [Aureobasidium mustum]|uniref:LSM domain-containing protein n=1 Tax=Aureobasidium mustum TaxID=2773714 RepID=A0A9N8PFP6_9PEZI|nr:unnamed protein product [Aureobasidium mustum]